MTALPWGEPCYAELPRLPHSGIAHSWDVWPAERRDAGTLNRRNPDSVARGTAAVVDGIPISLTLPLDQPGPPLFGRQPYRRTLVRMGRNVFDDHLDGFALQASSQWDGLRHIRAGEDGLFGGLADPEDDPARLGVQNWADGIIGRGVLVDLEHLGREMGYDAFAPHAVGPDELGIALAEAGSQLRFGDILCVHTGWLRRYLAKTPAERVEYADAVRLPEGRTWVGLEDSEEMAGFLWDHGISAVACDNPGVEVGTGRGGRPGLHRRLIPGLGFALGEMLDMRRLADHCRAGNRWTFQFVAVPLNLPGGVGSPANAIAVV